MKTSEIRTELKCYTELNPRGEALANGERWTMDGGRYNGYITIPAKWAFLFPRGDWERENLPDCADGGCTYDVDNKDGSITVGFDTLHSGDTEEFWTREETQRAAEQWADEIAWTIREMLERREVLINTPHTTVGELMSKLNQCAPYNHITVTDWTGQTYKQISCEFDEQKSMLYIRPCIPIPK